MISRRKKKHTDHQTEGEAIGCEELRNAGKQEDMSAVRTLQLLLVGLVLVVQFVVGTGAETGANNKGKKRQQ
ncbi:hypothetical protein JOQ06_027960 [Pogonophryne albipinna]|uniref:Uncharacterized protein n=1 Tax=Pogonophryne albipinna TaxID=1090488 RepID=A0AAD6A806_9TELE|nr:hypothetical protein JOQ06_027960 [Pogonophryne albipinna]